MLASLKIGVRLGAGYLVLIVLALLVGLIGIGSMSDINERVENMYTQELVTIESWTMLSRACTASVGIPWSMCSRSEKFP